jgi:hypothetical protein
MANKPLPSPHKASIAGGAVIATAIAIGLLMLSPAYAASGGYDFTVLATIPGPAPGGGQFTFDFEPWDLNNRGELSFCADLSTGGEGVFTGAAKGPLSKIIRPGDPAPGGGTFSAGCWADPGINDGGDIAAAFQLDPFTFPLGVNAGVYHFAHQNHALTAVLTPGVTPAPPKGMFVGAVFHAMLNNKGDVVFAGISTDADIAPGPPGNDGTGLGVGIYKADKHGVISDIARPGDSAPGGGVFDFAQNPWINDRDDIAFGGHVNGEECIDPFAPQSVQILCGESIYLRHAAGGQIESIAHQGQPAPGGGIYRLAFAPILANSGDMVFVGDLTPKPDVNQQLTYFLRSKGKVIRVAGKGDPMPGGGHLVEASAFGTIDYGVNNRGEVSFGGIVDTMTNGIPDSGVYVYSHGVIRLIARTGTVIPGAGTIAYVFPQGTGGIPYTPSTPFSGAAINDSGEVGFQATLTNKVGVLLLAKPHA